MLVYELRERLSSGRLEITEIVINGQMHAHGSSATMEGDLDHPYFEVVQLPVYLSTELGQSLEVGYFELQLVWSDQGEIDLGVFVWPILPDACADLVIIWQGS